MDEKNIGNKLTIIIPVYNESGVIEGVVRGVYEKIVRQVPGRSL